MFDIFILIALNTFFFSTFEMNHQFVTQMVQTSSADARISMPGHTTNAAPTVPVMESARTPAHVSLAFPPMGNSANLKQVTILLILEVLRNAIFLFPLSYETMFYGFHFIRADLKILAFLLNTGATNATFLLDSASGCV